MYCTRHYYSSLLMSIILLLILTTASLADILPARQQELVYMIRQDCGSCHGMTLKGGLGPSLLAQRLTQFNDKYLFETIKNGRLGTAMPPWLGILSDAEISWIVLWLKQGLKQELKQG